MCLYSCVLPTSVAPGVVFFADIDTGHKVPGHMHCKLRVQLRMPEARERKEQFDAFKSNEDEALFALDQPYLFGVPLSAVQGDVNVATVHQRHDDATACGTSGVSDETTAQPEQEDERPPPPQPEYTFHGEDKDEDGETAAARIAGVPVKDLDKTDEMCCGKEVWRCKQ